MRLNSDPVAVIGLGRFGKSLALELSDEGVEVLGIDSDRLFPVEGQRIIAAHARGNIDGDDVAVISSTFGHDGFLIEDDAVGGHLARLLAV